MTHLPCVKIARCCKVSAKTCSASTTLDEPATRIANLVTKIRKEDVSGRVYLQGRDRYRLWIEILALRGSGVITLQADEVKATFPKDDLPCLV